MRSHPRQFEERRLALRVGVLLFFISLITTAYSRARPEYGEQEAGFVNALLAPSYSWLARQWVPLKRYIGDFLIRTDVQRENRLLHQRVAALKSKVLALQEQEVENRRLKELLSANDVDGYSQVLASVISTDFGSKVYGITIDKGSSSGIDLRDPVVGIGGVVGLISAVSKDSSKVLLLIDLRSGIDVRSRSSRVRGVVRGGGNGKVTMDFVVSTNQIEAGEKVITSGMDGVFPGGLLVGQVSKINRGNRTLFREVELEPFVDFSKLEEVLVLKKKDTGHK
jgi:rod shape-determining protein MreC